MIKKLLAVAIVCTLSACASLQEELKNYVSQPEVTYKSIAIGEASMERLELTPTFNVTNPNSFPIPIDTVAYELSLNNKKMLAGETKAIGMLPGNGNKDVTLAIELTKETLSSLQQLLFKDRKIDYQIKGDVTAAGIAIPFEKSATLYIPDVKVSDLKVSNASFEQLDFVLVVAIDNQNEFSLPLEDVSYAVSSKGKALFNGALKNTKIAQGSNSVEIPVSIKPSDLFSSVFSLLLTPELPLHFEITSPLFTKSYDHPLNLNSFFL